MHEYFILNKDRHLYKECGNLLSFSAHKLTVMNAHVDWKSQSAQDIDAQFRALGETVSSVRTSANIVSDLFTSLIVFRSVHFQKNCITVEFYILRGRTGHETDICHICKTTHPILTKFATYPLCMKRRSHVK